MILGLGVSTCNSNYSYLQLISAFIVYCTFVTFQLWKPFTTSSELMDLQHRVMLLEQDVNKLRHVIEGQVCIISFSNIFLFIKALCYFCLSFSLKCANLDKSYTCNHRIICCVNEFSILKYTQL